MSVTLTPSDVNTIVDKYLQWPFTVVYQAKESVGERHSRKVASYINLEYERLLGAMLAWNQQERRKVKGFFPKTTITPTTVMIWFSTMSDSLFQCFRNVTNARLRNRELRLLNISSQEVEEEFNNLRWELIHSCERMRNSLALSVNYEAEDEDE